MNLISENLRHQFLQTGRAGRILALVAFTILLATWSAGSGAGTEKTDFLLTGTGKVIKVIDGDTVIIHPFSTENIKKLHEAATRRVRSGQSGTDLQSVSRRINVTRGYFTTRIGNINTPESVHPDASRNTPAGKAASEAAKQLIGQRFVDYQCYNIGYYGRPICSLQSDDGDFAIQMIRLGHTGYVQKYGKHPFKHERYLKAEQQAR